MFHCLKRALGAAAVFGWAGLALAADNQGSGQGSGSQAQTTPPVTQVAPTTSCCTGGDCGSGCGWLEPGCDEDCHRGEIILDGEWHILRPVINDNRAFQAQTIGANGGLSTVQANFQYKFESDPGITFGYRTCSGLGFTTTWFHLNNSSRNEDFTVRAGGPAVIIPAPTPILFITPVPFLGLPVPITFSNDIKMDIWDFDVTQKSEVCHWDLTFGGGIRYFHIAQDYSAVASTPNVPGVVAAGTVTDQFSNSYNAGGPTVILDGLRRFGDTGLGFYVNSRAGVLFGAKHENASLAVSSAAVAGIVGLPISTTVTSDNEATVGFAEIELGVQYSRCMGSVNPFVRFGFEGREYWGIGNAGGSVNIFSGNNSCPVGAYGLALTAGIGF